MELEILRLTEENKYLIEGFNCVESDEALVDYSARVRRRIKNHSKDMLNFLKEEAFADQEKGLSKTCCFN